MVSWNKRQRDRGYRNPVLEKKKIRLKTIEGIIRNNCPMEYSKAIAMIIYNTGLSKKTAVEYLGVFVDLDVIKIENNMVRLIEQKKEKKGKSKASKKISK